VLILAILFLMQPFLAARSLVSHRDSLSRQALLSETANGLESIKAANAGHRIESRMAGLVEDAADNLLSQRRLTHLGSSLTALCIHLTTIAVIFFGAIQITLGELSMGGLIACMMIVSRGMAPLGQVSQLLLRLQGVRASLKGLREVMDLEREDDAGKLMPRFECPAIRCVRAGFQYPGQPVAALSEIDLKIEPGERVGVIGRAGSGKSTLLRLFNRQLRASTGLVLFDGIDANQIAPVAIRRVCGYLPQDGTLFAGSVKENIALGSAFFPDHEIVAAARLAGVLSWANAHPRGLDMEVGERGVLLSGGQRQTVMIARLFLAGARVFLLDEPTNSLDLSAEKKFKTSLAQLLEKDGLARTLVLATHKLSLLKLVDRVIVIEAGKVLLDGPRDEVLVALQQKGEA
ncbi:MAG: ATP-binding cassette domain-containing protein, partial [Verrucomicrobiales bacterium]